MARLRTFTTARIEGVVHNDKNITQPGATVVLVPDVRSRPFFFQNTVTDQNGHYEFPAIAPGKYKVFAWDDIEPGLWYDPEFLKTHEEQGQKAQAAT